jgi:hypothetical protein
MRWHIFNIACMCLRINTVSLFTLTIVRTFMVTCSQVWLNLLDKTLNKRFPMIQVHLVTVGDCS